MKYEYKYFRKGANVGRADIVVNIKRPDIVALDNWSNDEKESLKKAIKNDLMPVINEFIDSLTKHIKPIYPLIGRKCKGFAFEDRKYGRLVFHPDMEKRIGEEGVLSEFNPDTNAYRISFDDLDYWYYPAELINEHLID